ncbi:nuclear body protein SP140-like protein [Nematolebias whitei]|uniref:nuclear body protein SP140-like protein n=1 Tax=Nematolebias whitei TaxID=451745 RepID=UPI00189AD221|nr:nuclear body protein SP140-like protein [Nematolebias whitei]
MVGETLKVIRMKSKENLKKEIYDLLDWIEMKRSEHIPMFWKCVFKEIILSQYPTLKMMRNSLLDGSFQFDTLLPEKMEEEDEDQEESPMSSEDDDSGKKKRKVRKMSTESDEVLPGPSAQLTPRQKKKSKKIHFSSPLKKGTKGEIWTWPLYKSQLPVTCGGVEGTLIRDRLAKGEKCILAKKQWFTPTDFEKFAGKGSTKNWKLSIRCMDTPVGQLIKDGHLKSVSYKRTKQVKNPGTSSDHLTTEDDSMDDEDEQQPESNPDYYKTMFKVTCGALSANLYKKRFASGTCSKSIRMETSWVTPVAFVKEALGHGQDAWRKDIEYDGKPLSSLIQAQVLSLHSLLCTCNLCRPEPEDLDDQKNDDWCFICKTEGEHVLVECDHCPRSFHQKCHMPHIDDEVKSDVRPWMCTFCVFNTNQVCRYADEQRTEAVLSRQMSQHMLECQYLLLYLCSTDEEQIFVSNPTLHIKNYPRFITTPMWLGKISEKLQKKQYLTVREFVSDVELIFTNCATFNQSNAEFRTMGELLKRLFDQEFKKAFNIQD